MASQTNTYTATSICGKFESQYSYIDPGLFNSANLTGLTPATKYYYRVGALVRLAPCCLTCVGKAAPAACPSVSFSPLCHVQNTTGGPVSAEYSFVSPPVTGPQTSVNVSPHCFQLSSSWSVQVVWLDANQSQCQPMQNV